MKTATICGVPAPRALSRPISRRRSDTDTSITFMIPTPATDSDTEAMATRVRVSTWRMESRVETTASWVMTVTSCARCRSAKSSSSASLPRSRSSPGWSSTRIRNSELRLNSRIAVPTGICTMSSKSKPSERPRGSSTPTTRKRHSPTRTTLPSGLSAPNSSLATVTPRTISEPPRSGSPGDR